MEYQKSVVELIRMRTSTRSFDGKNLHNARLKKMEDYISKINEGVKIKARFSITSNTSAEGSKVEKLGTYGVISGANSYIIGILGNNEENAPEFGYLFEKIILFATDLGLQTCWLGGTFKKQDFEQNMNLHEDEYIPVVSPIGYKKEKIRVLDSAMRAIAGSDKRKPWNELFFEENISTPLNEQRAGAYAVSLEMVRLAPSASNKQPWRIIKDDKKFHFYLCRTKGYGVANYDLQKNDIGIAKCHFELTAKELGLKGKWENQKNISLSNEWEYMTTWYIEA